VDVGCLPPLPSCGGVDNPQFWTDGAFTHSGEHTTLPLIKTIGAPFFGCAASPRIRFPHLTAPAAPLQNTCYLLHHLPRYSPCCTTALNAPGDYCTVYKRLYAPRLNGAKGHTLLRTFLPAAYAAALPPPRVLFCATRTFIARAAPPVTWALYCARHNAAGASCRAKCLRCKRGDALASRKRFAPSPATHTFCHTYPGTTCCADMVAGICSAPYLNTCALRPFYKQGHAISTRSRPRTAPRCALLRTRYLSTGCAAYQHSRLRVCLILPPHPASRLLRRFTRAIPCGAATRARCRTCRAVPSPYNTSLLHALTDDGCCAYDAHFRAVSLAHARSGHYHNI